MHLSLLMLDWLMFELIHDGTAVCSTESVLTREAKMPEA